MLRISLFILILGMGAFLIIRNITLKKQLKNGEIAEIKPRDFLPFGDKAKDFFNNAIDKVTGNEENDNQQNQENKLRLNKVSADVAGSAVVIIDDEIAGPVGTDKNGNNIYDKITAVQYVLKENGFVYSYIPKYKKSYLISETKIPHIQNAKISDDGNIVLFQYLDSDLSTEKSVLGKLGDSAVKILPDNIISYDMNQSGDFVYVKKSKTGSIISLINNFGNEVNLYVSTVTEWNVKFINNNELLLTTKASEYFNGVSYVYNIRSKSMTRLWGGFSGLTTNISSGGNYILRAVTEQSGPKLALYDNKTKSVFDLNKLGMVEKCAFSKDETILVCALPKEFQNMAYPDSWYLGEISTKDNFIKYTTLNKNETILPGFNDITEDFDVINLNISNTGDIMSFINKKDSSLWVYEE